MKTDLEKLKRESLDHLELSTREKDSVVSADVNKMCATIKALSKKKDLVVMVFEK